MKSSTALWAYKKPTSPRSNETLASRTTSPLRVSRVAEKKSGASRLRGGGQRPADDLSGYFLPVDPCLDHTVSILKKARSFPASGEQLGVLFFLRFMAGGGLNLSGGCRLGRPPSFCSSPCLPCHLSQSQVHASTRAANRAGIHGADSFFFLHSSCSLLIELRVEEGLEPGDGQHSATEANMRRCPISLLLPFAVSARRLPLALSWPCDMSRACAASVLLLQLCHVCAS